MTATACIQCGSDGILVRQANHERVLQLRMMLDTLCLARLTN